ncbi:GtrA family protein [Desulfosporosinus youngiae]|uniref:Putative membrane protein n=1 Tax=Desulfosporosinus youngiae DSM 17734 TaxID=768710 RepID=H5XSG2_9FIRM|nr:GtrA family protein [Desulfosporosinus youngiae]EHQ88062.1 putative membrane protein [Desulfosporosinus youngiae DSM 17734]
MDTLKESTTQISVIIRYGLVGLLGTLIHFSSVIALVELTHLDPVISSATGFVLVLLISYYLNQKWTFRIKNGGSRQFFYYTIVSLIGLGLNSAIMFIDVYVLRWNYLFGQCMVVVVVPVSNFLMNRRWTFRDTENNVDL